MSQPSLVFNNLCLAGHAESASMNNETVCLHVVLEIVNVQVWKRTSYSVNFEALIQLLQNALFFIRSFMFFLLHYSLSHFQLVFINFQF